MILGGPNLSSAGPIRVDAAATSTPAGRNASAVPSADQPAMICRYWVTRNWNATYEPKRTIAARLSRGGAPAGGTGARETRLAAATGGATGRASRRVPRVSSADSRGPGEDPPAAKAE